MWARLCPGFQRTLAARVRGQKGTLVLGEPHVCGGGTEPPARWGHRRARRPQGLQSSGCCEARRVCVPGCDCGACKHKCPAARARLQSSAQRAPEALPCVSCWTAVPRLPGLRGPRGSSPGRWASLACSPAGRLAALTLQARTWPWGGLGRVAALPRGRLHFCTPLHARAPRGLAWPWPAQRPEELKIASLRNQQVSIQFRSWLCCL